MGRAAPPDPAFTGVRDPAGPGPIDRSATGQRYCSIVILNPDKVEDYLQLHKQVPVAVKKALREHHVRNYSIYLKMVESNELDDQNYAVRYYEYVGSSHEVDMTMLARDPDFRQWRDACEACQLSLLPPSSGEWWAPMGEIFHND